MLGAIWHLLTEDRLGEGDLPYVQSFLEDLAAAIPTKAEGQQPDTLTAAAGPMSGVKPTAKSKRVILYSGRHRPEIDGKPKSTLTVAQCDTIKALIEAGETGLTKDGLDHHSSHTDARKILERLAAKNSDWKTVILFPGTSGKHYRIE